jgi:hypothetical protein
MNVYAATQAFGSELRVHLIHYYAENPGRQVDAMRALGVERAVVSLNVRALLETGVLVRGPERIYQVNPDRFRELIRALEEFGPRDVAERDGGCGDRPSRPPSGREPAG